MDLTVTQLIFRESGGFAGLQRGCTVEPATLPDLPRSELRGLVERAPDKTGTAAIAEQVSSMPDMQIYTLELVMSRDAERERSPEPQPEHRVLRYPASDVPSDLSTLIDFLREHARPLEPR
jgi:hypothetical protein